MRDRGLIPVLVVATLALPFGSAATTRGERAVVDAMPLAVAGVMVVDGVLGEAAWEQATPITEFLQREPEEGATPSHRTDARIAYDAEALYVGVRAYDPEPERIAGLLTRRDQRSPSDWIRVVVDSYHDRRTAYEFSVNPAGVKHDRYWFNDTSNDDSWDAVWDVQVARDAEGWLAEFRIPFSQLRFNGRGEGAPVGFAIVREVPHQNETDTWPLLARSATGYVSEFAEVRGLRLTQAPRRLELMPYTLGAVTTQPLAAGDPLNEGAAPSASTGLDVKYAVTPALTLTATANPDFGQVEADPAAVNLDAFELFFPERRPFFVEGAGTFRFNVDCNDGECTGLFYSRRIGRSPQGSADTSDGEFSKAPTAASIIGAAKLTGRAGGFAVGALSAYTAEEHATIAADDLTRRTQSIEPFTAFNVVRARREFGNRSNLGFMLTSTNRSLTADTSFLADAAYTGGLDYDWRLSDRVGINGFWAGSTVRGSTEAITRLQENAVHGFQRPDADYVELDPQATSLSGHAGAVNVAKIGGERVRFNFHYGYKSPGFDMNDLGYQRRADEGTINHWIQWRDNDPGRFVRSYVFNVNQWAGWNFGGDRLFGGGNVNMHWTWQNNWRTGFGVNANAAPLRDRVTRGGPAVLGNPSASLWFYADLDDRRTVFPGYNGYYERDGLGTVRYNINPRVTVRPSSAVQVSAGVRYAVNDDDAQWVENVEGDDGTTHYVFGRLEQRTLAVTFRVNYTLTPNLSFQSYAEPFVSAGAYQDFRELVDGRNAAYDRRYAPYAYTGTPDFNYRSFRTTNVLRWEFRPGSTLFAVWQQGRQDQADPGDFRFGRDFSGLFATPAHNTFLIKVSYWINR